MTAPCWTGESAPSPAPAPQSILNGTLICRIDHHNVDFLFARFQLQPQLRRKSRKDKAHDGIEALLAVHFGGNERTDVKPDIVASGQARPVENRALHGGRDLRG